MKDIPDFPDFRKLSIYVSDLKESLPLERALEEITKDWSLEGNITDKTTIDLVRALKMAVITKDIELMKLKLKGL